MSQDSTLLLMKKKPMAHPLYLTAQEQKVFEKLPAKLREGWKVEEEKLNAYETPRQLKIRREIFRKKDSKFLKLVKDLEKVKVIRSPEDLVSQIGEIPKHLLLNIVFMLGAVYLRIC